MELRELFKNIDKLTIGDYILREIDFNDLDDIFEIFSNKKVMKYYDLYPHKVIEESKNLISNFKKNSINGNMIRFGIIEASTNKLIGTCGFHNFSKENNKAEIGYDLNINYWNRGIMTKIINRLVEIGINDLNLNRIEAFVETENINSRKLLLSCKFTEEGLLRDYEKCKERFIDLYIYGIIKKDLI